MFKVELNLSDRSRDMLHKMPGVVRPALFKGMQEAMLLAEREARLNTSGRVLKRRSGRLRASITNSVVISGGMVIGRIGTNVVYARIHELGGTILPRKAQALKFKIPGVGWRTVKRVQMPARPFLRPAIANHLDEIGGIIARHIETAFGEI